MYLLDVDWVDNGAEYALIDEAPGATFDYCMGQYCSPHLEGRPSTARDYTTECGGVHSGADWADSKLREYIGPKKVSAMAKKGGKGSKMDDLLSGVDPSLGMVPSSKGKGSVSSPKSPTLQSADTAKV